MRAILSVLFLASAGCAGLSLGDSGDDEVPRCADMQQELVTDLAQPQPGFSSSPDELLAPAMGVWSGTLKLNGGDAVPIEVHMELDSESVRVTRATDFDGTACEPWLTADVKLQIDAGSTLQGMAEGNLTTRGELQIRVDWVLLADFDTTLSAPYVDDQIVRGPALQLGLLLHADQIWQGDWDFVAEIQDTACDSASSMCTTTPTGAGFDYQALGTIVLGPRGEP